MWLFVKDLFHRGWQEALTRAGTTDISVIWLGFGVLLLGFFFTVGIEWLSGDRNRIALTSALKSWKSWVGAVLALFVGWLFLVVYSIFIVMYHDHQKPISAETPPPIKAPEKLSKTDHPSSSEGKSRIKIPIRQNGKGNTANPGVVTAPVNVSQCGVFQNGGSNNTASPVCNPPANPNAAVVTYQCNGYKVSRGTGNGSILDITSDPTLTKDFSVMMDFGRSSNWEELRKTCVSEIAQHSDWLTPYLFCTDSERHLGNIAEAKSYLSKFEEKKGNAYQEAPCSTIEKVLKDALITQP